MFVYVDGYGTNVIFEGGGSAKGLNFDKMFLFCRGWLL